MQHFELLLQHETLCLEVFVVELFLEGEFHDHVLDEVGAASLVVSEEGLELLGHLLVLSDASVQVLDEFV